MMRLPPWISSKHKLSSMRETKGLLRRYGVTTVCEEARCPNKPECFSKPTAAFLLMGPNCTRSCGFCSVMPSPPTPLDPGEPNKVARAALAMGLRHVVMTSVTRDDLNDGGAEHFAAAIAEVRNLLPGAAIEVLTPDFKGSAGSLATVLGARPDVFNHNVETVPALYKSVRPGADYQRSLGVLGSAKEIAPAVTTKSGLMLGLGESPSDVLCVLKDLRGVNCDIVTIGQYLRPGRRNLPVAGYIKPEVFDELGREALGMGFRAVASGPLVRSSMNAGGLYLNAEPEGVSGNVPVQQN